MPSRASDWAAIKRSTNSKGAGDALQRACPLELVASARSFYQVGFLLTIVAKIIFHPLHKIDRIDYRMSVARKNPLLPNEGYNAMPDLFLVFCISRQIPSEKALLVIEPPNQKWHHTPECEETPKRTEGQRRADQV